MPDLVLVRFDKTGSSEDGRALVRRLRETALAALPEDGRRGKVGRIGGGRFKIRLRGGEGKVDGEGAVFELDEPDFAMVRLIYELARTGGMAWVDAWGSAGTVVFERAAVKALPAGLRRPRPVVCTSAQRLARLMGVSANDVSATGEPDERPWSKGLDKRSRSKLPGLEPPALERYVYVQIMAGETIEALMKRLWAFIRTGKKAGKLREPTGGGISFNHWDNWQIRLPAGQVLVPWHISGYESRRNADHLIPANLEAWQAIAYDFARQSRRKIATIADGPMLVVRGGGRYAMDRLEYRRFEVD